MARILVIDDDDLVRGTVKAILATAGHDIVLASDGEQGLRRLEDGAVDLVIMDLFMPQKEGIETIRDMRRQGIKTAVIVMTGGPALRVEGGRRADVDYLQMAKSFGADGTIHKPFSRQQLLAAVDACLGASGKA
jgi:DNA-binding response OmpR family regulator